MEVGILAAVAIVATANLLVLLVLLRRNGSTPDFSADLTRELGNLEKATERVERAVREEMGRNRDEVGKSAHALRGEVSTALHTLGEALTKRVADAARAQQGHLDGFAAALQGLVKSNDGHLDAVRGTLDRKLADLQTMAARTAAADRESNATAMNAFAHLLMGRVTDAATVQGGQLESFGTALRGLVDGNEMRFEAVRGTLERKLADLQSAAHQTAAADRDAARAAMAESTRLLLVRLTEAATGQTAQLETFSTNLAAMTRSNGLQLDQMRDTVERKLTTLQADNAAKLEQMRATVDEKLHATLEARLGESFKLVSDRLEAVHKGLGEMQALAHGVGDLKRVLTNVKTRGTWGEVQLGNLLEQMLTPDQYGVNVVVNPESTERVEFAVKLPGRDGMGTPVWLPMDAKFPQEDYQRLVEAADAGDAAGIAQWAAALEVRVCGEARKIRDKYVCVPHTTDFAILFLPVEGLFAEVLRRPGLCDGILRDHRVVLAGPTTLAALLSSLQMGFRTLALEKRSSEVWQVLGAVKSEFGKFGGVMAKVQKKLQEATHSVDEWAVRGRAMERKLRDAEAVPGDDAGKLLELEAVLVREAGAEPAGERAVP